ncbi:MAG: type I DNA topoisomerase [Ruminococcaceae bacterium]|nr:type I DNA topoisomerase [Oscillospiraceae bacterium]
MANLVILESPAKAKTVKKYLGKGYDVMASMGHVRDLPSSSLGVDPEKNFKPKYINIKRQAKVIKELKERAAKCDTVYLATDPDREGEAIAWHLAHILGLKGDQANRVTFTEITETGIRNGMAAPRGLDMDLVNAQQARRILDRIVGYKISPFLWKKVKSGLSAGRVQSVVVRLIVDREEEIRAFVPEEFWEVEAKLREKSSGKLFTARYWGENGKKRELSSKEETDTLLADMKSEKFTVTEVKKGVRKKNPAPPFITSTLQQDAAAKLGFQTKRTMRVAQELYEGVEIAGMGAVGLITYMRTDSLRISEDARKAGCDYIRSVYGDKYLPATPRVFKAKKGAQDAHEAIRPSTPSLTPDAVKASLTSDQYKLYKLIWERFTASLMASAEYNTVSADLDCAGHTFKASGSTVRFDGFTALYDYEDAGDEKSAALPPLTTESKLTREAVNGIQKFTQPPARYNERSLVKALEENGIGRPSTYAPTIDTVLKRQYVEREGKALKPTALGEVTTGLMKEMFSDIVDVKFTAKMESDLDKVEDGTADWVKTLDRFYGGFSKTLKTAESALDGTRIKVPNEETDEVCELCGRKMVIKTGRFGKFLACPGYPECKNTKNIVAETPGFCPKCGSKIIQRTSKRGRKFFGCAGYPSCQFMTWSEPVEKTCPDCGKTLFKKSVKGDALVCLNEACRSYAPPPVRGTKKTEKE